MTERTFVVVAPAVYDDQCTSSLGLNVVDAGHLAHLDGTPRGRRCKAQTDAGRTPTSIST